MATALQIAANRRNSKRSTGPRTEAGKSVSRGNALKHGMTSAKLILIDGEDENDFSDLRHAVFAKFDPQDAIEVSYAEALAATLWRMKRPGRFEALLIEQTKLIEQRRERDSEVQDDPFGLGLGGFTTQESEEEGDEAEEVDEDVDPLGQAIETILADGEQLARIWRYEAHLVRHARTLAEELRQLISERSIEVAGDTLKAP